MAEAGGSNPPVPIKNNKAVSLVIFCQGWIRSEDSTRVERGSVQYEAENLDDFLRV